MTLLLALCVQASAEDLLREARLHQAEDRPVQALAAWQAVLDLPRDPRARWEWEKGEAQWEIVGLQMRLGDHAKALDGLRDGMQRHPLPTLCGTCNEGRDLQRLRLVAVCLEHLGRWEEALELQFSARPYGPPPADLHLRTLDLYDAADRRDALRRRLDAEGPNPGQAVFRRALQLREEAESGRFDLLADLLADRNSMRWEQEEARRLLARHPAETFDALAARLPAFPRSEPLLELLAGLRTVEAAEALELAAVRTNDDRFASTLLYVLGTMGPSARESLDRLPWRGSWHTRRVLKEGRASPPRGPAPSPCPERRAAIPPDFRLP